jgi:hypothetical protein
MYLCYFVVIVETSGDCRDILQYLLQSGLIRLSGHKVYFWIELSSSKKGLLTKPALLQSRLGTDILCVLSSFLDDIQALHHLSQLI